MKYAKLTTSLLLKNGNIPYKCVEPSMTAPPVIVFAGTQNWVDLVVDDLNIKPVLWPPSKLVYSKMQGRVQGGFASRTERLFKEMEPFTTRHESFVLSGHSLGGACAILLASLLNFQGKHVSHVYTFGVPKLATGKFQRIYKDQGLWNKTYNFVTPDDPVVNRIPYFYKGVGRYKTLQYESKNVWDHHDLSTYHECL